MGAFTQELRFKKIIRKYKQIHDNTFENLDEMDNFQIKYKLPKLTQETNRTLDQINAYLKKLNR